MYWVVGIACFIAGLAIGLVLMALTATKRFEEINAYWYSVCMGLTDGKEFKKDDRDETLL